MMEETNKLDNKEVHDRTVKITPEIWNLIEALRSQLVEAKLEDKRFSRCLWASVIVKVAVVAASVVASIYFNNSKLLIWIALTPFLGFKYTSVIDENKSKS